jgi:flagellin-specific chaperone FliS
VSAVLIGGGEIASRLEGIYVFCKRLLIEARIQRDAGRIDKERADLIAIGAYQPGSPR